MEKFVKNDCINEHYADTLAVRVSEFCSKNGFVVKNIDVCMTNGCSLYIKTEAFLCDFLAKEAWSVLKNENGSVNLKIRVSDHSSGVDSVNITGTGTISFSNFQFYVENGYIWALGYEEEAQKRYQKRQEFLRLQAEKDAQREEFLKNTEYSVCTKNREDMEFFATCVEYAGCKVEIREYNGVFFTSPGLDYFKKNLFYALLSKKDEITQKMAQGVKPEHIKVSNKTNLYSLKLKIG